MAEITTVPFGPQHPVLPEPIHLDLELKDERVVRAVPSIGYVHRGLENWWKRGISNSSFMWQKGYAASVPSAMAGAMPKRWKAS